MAVGQLISPVTKSQHTAQGGCSVCLSRFAACLPGLLSWAVGLLCLAGVKEDEHQIREQLHFQLWGLGGWCAGYRARHARRLLAALLWKDGCLRATALPAHTAETISGQTIADSILVEMSSGLKCQPGVAVGLQLQLFLLLFL